MVRDAFQPVLGRLDSGDHVRQLGTDDSLRVEGLAKYDSLVGPFHALLHDLPLCAQGRAAYHPSFVVEVAEDDFHTGVDLAEGVGNGYTDIVEGDIGRAGCRRVCSFDGLGFNVI